MRYSVADLHRIRAWLSGARADAEKVLERRRRPLEQPEAPAGGSRPAELELELELEHERTRREQLEKDRDELEAALERTDAGRAEAERRVAALGLEVSAGRAPSEERHAAIQATCELLERELAAARLELEQASVGRDRARAELEAARAELRKVQFLLDAERAGGELGSDDAGGPRRAERKRRASRSEKRIAELEGELETERELRKDFELALELLQQQEADDRRRVEEAQRAAFEPQMIPNGERTPEPKPETAAAETLASAKPADAPPESQLGSAGEEPAEGWGVPLEAFPIDEQEERQGAVGKGSASNYGTSRHVPFRRRRRPAGG